MKKSIKITIIILLVVLMAMTLVACGGTPDENVNGNYYKIDKDSGEIEILKISGGEFTVTTFTIKNVEDIPDNYDEIETVYVDEIAKSAKVVKGTCTYTNNFFIKSRLDLKFTEGKKGSTYAYLTEETYKDDSTRSLFAYSPKMNVILLYAVLGFAITLTVLCVLMGVIKLQGFSVDKISAKIKAKKKNKESQEIAVAEEVKLAKGSAGDLKLENVSERDAAMIMAIVADELKEPLNSLRFISIRDITDEEGKN